MHACELKRVCIITLNSQILEQVGSHMLRKSKDKSNMFVNLLFEVNDPVFLSDKTV